MIQKTVVVTDFLSFLKKRIRTSMYGHMYGSIWFIIVKEYGGKLELKGQKSQILMESLEYSATLTSDSHCG